MALAALAATALLVLAGPSLASTTIGSRIGDGTIADFDICAFDGAAGAERSCTDAQLPGGAKSLWETNLVAPFDGTIVGWSVITGAPTPATAAVKLRLRLIDSSSGGGGDDGPFVALPLDQPGSHVFPAHLPIRAHDRIGLDSVVTSSGGYAAVPIARLRPVGARAGHVQEWDPPLVDGIESTALGLEEQSELLLSAEIEPERVAPRTKLTYANQQDLLRTGAVAVQLRSSEEATAIASGQLEKAHGGGPHASRVTYPLHSVTRPIYAREKTTLRLRLPRHTRDAAATALDRGERVIVKVSVFARDAAGNQARATVATIRLPD